MSGIKASRGGVVAFVILVSAVLAVPVFAYTDAKHMNVLVQGGTTGSATAICPAGEHADFGGLSAQLAVPLGSGPEIFAQAMYLDSTQTHWTVIGTEGAGHKGVLSAHVYCSTHPARTKVTKKVTIGPNATTAVATCPAGKVVLGGGFNTPRGGGGFPAVFVTMAAVGASPRQWNVRVLNVSVPPGGKLTSIAYCGAGPAPSATVKQVTLNPPLNHTVPAVANCPVPKSLVFGGFITNFPTTGGPAVLPFTWASSSPTRWTVTAFDPPSSSAGFVRAIAYCR